MDGKRVVVTEDVIQQDLCLDDADGVECLPNEEIFTEVAHMGYKKPSKRTAWNEFSCSMASVVIWLATGRNFNFSKYMFDGMVRNVDSPSKFLVYPLFIQVIINAQVEDLSSHTNQYTSPTLTQKVFANMRREEEDEEEEVPNAPTPPSPTTAPSPPPQDLPLHLHKLKLLYHHHHHRKIKLKPLNLLWGRIKAIDVDEDMTLVDVETQVDAELQGKKDDDNAAIKDVSAAELTVFDDEEVTMTMA
nr:hypothetical protein [Tanacetum cinerariifolium]